MSPVTIALLVMGGAVAGALAFGAGVFWKLTSRGWRK
jgi:hypothetical protein